MVNAPKLEATQEDVLCMVVEASRRVAATDRQKFYAIGSFGGTTLQHPGLGSEAVPIYEGDIETLGRMGLLFVSDRQRDVLTFDVSPRGFEVYGELKRRKGESVERIESEVRRFLDSTEFAARYPLAQKKWSQAESLLWDSNSNGDFTTIGHLTREAMQEFADALVRQICPTEAVGSKTEVIKRIRTVLNERVQLGKVEKPFVEALLSYWGAVSDLVQRQEHGGQKEGEALGWDDARRVVLQLAITMFEIDTVARRHS